MKYKLTLFAVCAIVAISTAACANSKTNSDLATDNPSETAQAATNPEKILPEIAEVDIIPTPQLEEVKQGEDIAVIKTSMGDITVRFFPEYAPKAVENFLTHSKNGYYDGVKFHRVINDFVIQGGDPKGDGTGGESIYGEDFELERYAGLKHIQGALAMARPQYGQNSSQFYIVERDYLHPQEEEELKTYKENITSVLGEDETGKPIPVGNLLPEALIDKFLESGGTLGLDFPEDGVGYTVFGQVIDGMDVVHKIADVKVNDPNQGVPVEDVTISTIEVKTYE